MSSSTRASTMTDTRAQHLETSRWQRWSDLWRRFRRHRAAMTGFLVLGTMLGLVLTASVWTRHDPTRQQLSEVLRPMSAQHLLGTDHLGRDMGARLLYGGRLSLLIRGVAARTRVVLRGAPGGGPRLPAGVA